MGDFILWYIAMSPVFIWAAYVIGRDHGISEGFRLARKAFNKDTPHD